MFVAYIFFLSRACAHGRLFVWCASALSPQRLRSLELLGLFHSFILNTARCSGVFHISFLYNFFSSFC